MTFDPHDPRGLTYDIIMFVANKEAMVREAYYDSVDVLTWGFGLTANAGIDPHQYWKKPASVEECVRVYIDVLVRYNDDVTRAFDGLQLTEEQRAAALSFHWNTGSIGRARWVRQVVDGKSIEAFQSIMNWKNPPEIIPRRREERDMFFGGKLTPHRYVTEYTTHSNGRPNWKSAKRVDISGVVGGILRVPEKSEPVKTENGRGLWSRIRRNLKGNWT
jgi:lysozyme